MTDESTIEIAATSEPIAEQPPRQGDLTKGPILKTLIAFSIPMLIGNVVQTLNGSINAIWVGRLLGENALAATTNANGIMFLMFALIFGFGMSSNVRVGQHYGAGNVEAARRTFGSGLGFTLGIAIAAGVLGAIFAPALLRLLATPQGAFEMALTYLRVIFFTIAFGGANMMIGMGLRGVGDAKSPMVATVITVVLDLVLNPLLIIGWGPVPKLGISGSAIASFIAGLGGVVYLIWQAYARDLPLRLRGHEFGYLIPRRAELAYILGKGMPMGAQMLLVSSAQMIMIGLVNREGIDTTAAYGASMQLWNYLQMPAFAISSGVSAMVAQSIGAGDHKRVSAVTSAGLIANLALTGVLAALLVLASHPLLALFLGSDSPAMPIARHIQYIVTWSFMVIGASMTVGGTMRSYGVVWMPMLIMFLSFYPVRVGFYFLAYGRMGSEALWWSYPVATVFSITGTWLLYTRGNWRNNRHLAYQRNAEG
ncbi:MAG: MATE family efflux transporter [Novosphingobium sp.]